jgi:hypothetical protein
MTRNLLSLCKDDYCRLHVESAQQGLLDTIVKVDSPTLCQRLGYCLPESSFEPSATLLRLRNLVQHQTKTLEERLESHNICSEFGQLKTMCEHLMISVKSRQYAYVYTALLTNNPKLIHDDIREQLATKVKTDVCDLCKNAVQSAKDFSSNALVRIIFIFKYNSFVTFRNQFVMYYFVHAKVVQ